VKKFDFTGPESPHRERINILYHLQNILSFK
jgi:hypothetical protein